MPAEAAANGDYLLPTVFHSVQSDESRHISNGYATLLMALSDEDNRQLLERDLRYAWWNNHRVVDAAIGTFIEYGTKDRRKDRESYAEMWRRWIYDDYYRAYLIPLEKYGLVIPHDLIEESWKQIWEKGYVHEVAQFFATGWLANYWRIDGMTDEDFEWFEYKYPGWYDKYGKWWENYNRLAVPNGHNPIVFEDVDYVYPARCWTCMVPCLVREDIVTAEVDGVHRTYCHEVCRWTDVEAFRPYLPGSRDPEHGPPGRPPRVGDAVPRLELGRRGLRHGLRPRRRQHHDGAAASGSRPQEDVDAGPHAPLPAAAAARTSCSTRWTTPAAPPSSRTTGSRARPVDRHRRTPERGSGEGGGPAEPPPALSLPGPTLILSREAAMGEKHIVRFEPVGIEIEVDEDQTILRAAAENGVQLMHGCKEGQCAACKSFVLEGDMDDIDLERYSTFALPDYEKEEGQTLLCRAHAYSDLVIELLQYDEEIIRNGLPLKKGVAEVVSNDPVTHDMRHLVLKLIEPDGRDQVLPRPVPRPHGARHRGVAVVLDGEHTGARRPVRVRDQGVSGRSVLRASGHKLAVGDRLDVEGPLRHLHAAGKPQLADRLPRRRCGDGPGSRPAPIDGGARRGP